MQTPDFFKKPEDKGSNYDSNLTRSQLTSNHGTMVMFAKEDRGTSSSINSSIEDEDNQIALIVSSRPKEGSGLKKYRTVDNRKQQLADVPP